MQNVEQELRIHDGVMAIRLISMELGAEHKARQKAQEMTQEICGQWLQAEGYKMQQAQAADEFLRTELAAAGQRRALRLAGGGRGGPKWLCWGP